MFLLVAASGAAQMRNDHLVPDDCGALAGCGASAYDTAVRDSLLQGMYGGAFLAVTLPSFQPEWAVWVEGETEWSVCTRAATVSIWNGNEPHKLEPVPPKTCAQLSAPVARTIRDRWVTMLRGTRYKTPDGTAGADGVTYHFSGFGMENGRMAGHVWSPEPDSSTGRLVALARSLRAYALAPTPEREASLCKLAKTIPAGTTDPKELCD